MQQFDIVLFGATSFVGKLVAACLLNYSIRESNLSWAIAGRSGKKLTELKKQLGKNASDLPILICDAHDEHSLKAMCDSTRLVISTVGPYALYGEPLVRLCAARGTDYCDLCGEPQFIAKMIRRYEKVARNTGSRIVHACGFDSIPSDLGVYFLQSEANKRYGLPCSEVKMRVRKMRGGVSGGTIASMLNVIKAVRADEQLRRLLANPYALCPRSHGYTVRQRNHKSAEFDEEFNCWSAPFAMASINTRVVHRTNALLSDCYGKHFFYDEALLVGPGTKGHIKAHAIAAGLAALIGTASFRPTRWLLETFILPKSGEGPDENEQIKGFYDIRFIGKADSKPALEVSVAGNQDPGYGSTSKMLAETAICLSEDISKLEKHGGIWTPASLFGAKLINRLEVNAGLSFEVRSQNE